MAAKRTIEGKSDADNFRYPIYVREVFMSKIKGRNNANINKLCKKYDIIIECIKEGSSNPHFLLIGKKSNVKKAVIRIRNRFKQYIIKPPKKVKKKDIEGYTNGTSLKTHKKQYDLRKFESPFPISVIEVIGQFYYGKSIGVVKLWKPYNRFGFITINKATEVFVFYKDIYNYPKTGKSLQKGEAVEFAVVHGFGQSDLRPKAIYVTGPNGQSVKGYADVNDQVIKQKIVQFYEENQNKKIPKKTVEIALGDNHDKQTVISFRGLADPDEISMIKTAFADSIFWDKNTKRKTKSMVYVPDRNNDEEQHPTDVILRGDQRYEVAKFFAEQWQNRKAWKLVYYKSEKYGLCPAIDVNREIVMPPPDLISKFTYLSEEWLK